MVPEQNHSQSSRDGFSPGTAVSRENLPPLKWTDGTEDSRSAVPYGFGTGNFSAKYPVLELFFLGLGKFVIQTPVSVVYCFLFGSVCL